MTTGEFEPANYRSIDVFFICFVRDPQTQFVPM
jgi:hypothetical protein